MPLNLASYETILSPDMLPSPATDYDTERVTDKLSRFVTDLVHANGLKSATIQRNVKVPIFSEHPPSAKVWDVVVTHDRLLIAAVDSSV